MLIIIVIMIIILIIITLACKRSINVRGNICIDRTQRETDKEKKRKIKRDRKRERERGREAMKNESNLIQRQNIARRGTEF